MGIKSDHESKLLEASKTFDAAISNKDVSQLPQLLADSVILHHDGLTLGDDIVGQEAVTAYFKSYPSNYHYSAHDVIAGAVDENDNTAFSFWQDKDVKPANADTSSTDTVGIWHHVFDKEDKIAEIYFLRALSKDELESKMKDPPPQNTQFDVSKFKSSTEQPSEERAQTHEKAARMFNDIWRTGDPSAAAEIMTDDVTIYDPVLGSKTSGRQDFENMIKGFSQNWTTKNNTSSIAVTAGDKAFIFWKNTGEPKAGKTETLYGLNMLVFNSEGKINDVLGFRQLTKTESVTKVKESMQKA